jgi:hypothetical protein
VKQLAEFRIKPLKGFPVYTITTPWPNRFAQDQSGFFEFFQVLAHGALSQWKVFHNFPANAFFLLGQNTQDGYAGRVGQGFGKSSQGLLAGAEFFLFGVSHFKMYIANIRLVFILSIASRNILVSGEGWAVGGD